MSQVELTQESLTLHDLELFDLSFKIRFPKLEVPCFFPMVIAINDRCFFSQI